MARLSKAAIAQILIGDFGSSKTKIISQLADGTTTTLPMDPYVVELSSERLSELRTQYKANLPPENQAWVRYEKGTFAVGNLGRVQQGQLKLHHLKQEGIVPKALGAVWASAQQQGLGHKFSLGFVGLLPAGEMSARDELKQELTQALKEFEAPTGIFRVKATVDFIPEGSGVAAYKEVMDPHFSDKVCAFFMLGFRNASVLITEGGIPSIIRSSKWGFSYLVQMVADDYRVTEQSIEILTPVICNALLTPQFTHKGYDIESEVFYQIAHPGSAEKQAQEVRNLHAATANACDRYLNSLTEWMQDVLNSLPNRCDEIIVSGGTAQVLERLLSKRWLDNHKPYSFYGGVQLPRGLDLKGLGVRWDDPYAALLSVSAKVFPDLYE